MGEDGSSSTMATDDTKANAVILAGALNQGPLREISEEKYEALVSVGGRCLVQYVIDALRESRRIEDIILVGFPEFRGRLDLEGVQLIPAGDSFPGSVRMGLEMSSGTEHLLFVTADVPLLSGPIIDELIEGCLGQEGDFFVPVVTREVSESRYPEVERTFAPLREGGITLGNCFLGTEHSIRRVLPELERFYDARKSILRMAVLLGPWFLLRLVTRTMSVGYVEKVFRRITGAYGVAVFCQHPEVALDVDRPDHVRAVEGLLGDDPG